MQNDILSGYRSVSATKSGGAVPRRAAVNGGVRRLSDLPRSCLDLTACRAGLVRAFQPKNSGLRGPAAFEARARGLASTGASSGSARLVPRPPGRAASVEIVGIKPRQSGARAQPEGSASSAIHRLPPQPSFRTRPRGPPVSAIAFSPSPPPHSLPRRLPKRNKIFWRGVEHSLSEPHQRTEPYKETIKYSKEE
ncbi:MAG: hypothetical protein JWO26_2956 [Rhodospirillales bacterium]|nr:hypothetical protein [Rhodospirillales bacterium]